MAEFRQAKEAVDALEERLAVLTQRQEGDGESVEEKARALRFILDECSGTTNELMEKFRARCEMLDPITNEPRFGPNMMAKVAHLLERFDAIKTTLESTDIVQQIETQAAHWEAQQERERQLLLQQKREAQRAEAARLEALHAEHQRREQQELERLAREREREQQRVAELAVLAQKKRDEREVARRQEAERLQEEEERRAQLNAAIPVGKEGLENAIEMLRESSGSAEQFRRSLEKLHVVVLNICASPENVAFRHIPKDNAHFHTDLGQFRGGHQCLLALGFREIEPEEGKAVFTLEEPDLSVDLDAWSDWFDNLKAMSECIGAKLQA